MPQKTVGYVELEWTCKRCGTKNPGTQKTCLNCGAPMGEGEQFDLPAQQQLISDAAAQAAAERGPDVHCPYCGARNQAGTEICAQCGGDLKEAAARQQGRVLGAYQEGPVPEIACPACGTLNPPNAPRCGNCGASLSQPSTPLPPASAQAAKPAARSRLGLAAILIGVLAVVACLAVFLALAFRKQDQPAVVQSVNWERSIPVIELLPVTYEDWKDQIPTSAELGACQDKYRRTQSEPAPGAEEVCGTPYTVDQGSGVGKVVQDCEYRVFDSWCKYTVEEWQTVDTVVAKGADFNPAWPSLSLREGQREGERSESYRVVFQAGDGRSYIYSAGDLEEFSQFVVGSRWTLEVNGLGGVVGVQQR